MRAPFQILAIPYRIKNDMPVYCVLHRADLDQWQFVAGGGEDGELPLEAAQREAFEEIGAESDGWCALKSLSYIPTTVINERYRRNWDQNTHVIPEYAFGFVWTGNIKLSHEHTAYEWISYGEAVQRLKWDSNRTALYELDQKLKSHALPQTADERKHDLCVPCGNGILNVRVGAIIMKEGKLLMVGNSKVNYLYSVGGRIQFGETSEEAVIREVLEETGVRMEIDRLGFVHENFFRGDSLAKAGKPVHELSFYFYMKVPKDFTPISNSFSEDRQKEFLVWVMPNESVTMFPAFLKTELQHPTDSVRHIVEFTK